jgi:uncharacterized cupin superfamily protein
VHQVINSSDDTARVPVTATMRAPDVVEYPDSGKIVFAQPPGSGRRDKLKRFLRGDATTGYLDGEPTEL